YMMDSLRPILSGTDAQLVDLMAARQRRLGDLHDLDLLLDRLDRFGGKENREARTQLRRLRAALVRRRAALARSYRAFLRTFSRRGGSVSRLRQMLSRLEPG
ncbi:MAG: hypothetical protein HY736_01845, partial [Verrucomicrobia bacterium]|nr:hypothetical protein [Verrucomicrobiota bacterium]